VRIRFYGMVYEEVGTREWEIELVRDSTVNDLLSIIVERQPSLCNLVYDETGVFREYLEVAVNHTDIIGLKGLETVLQEGDIVLIMPPIGGG
jgi:molybdopterin synthase sulfur carrier subunit